MSILSPLLSVIVTIVYSAACLGAGVGAMRLVRRRFGQATGRSNDMFADLATLFLAGLCLINFGLTVLGLAGLMRPVPIVILLAGGLAGLAGAGDCLTALRQSWRTGLTAWRTEPAWLRLIALLTVLFALGFGASALVRPPTGDAEAFYMAYAKIMASTGRLEPMAGLYTAFSTIGLPGELHFTALMVLADSHAAKLFVWPIALASAGLLSGIVSLCGVGRIGRTIAMAILFTSPTFTHYITDGKVDLFGAAFGLASLYWAVTASTSNPPKGALAWVGLFAGAATVAKFSNLPTLGIALTLLLTWRNFGGNSLMGIGPWRKTAVDAVQVAAWAILAWLPQLLKNGVLFGAPLAPFIGPQGAGWLEQVWFSPEVTRRIVLTYPFALVFGRYPMQGGGLSFLLLAFAPLVLMLPKPVSWRDSLLVRVSLAALLSTAVWVAFRPSVIAPRYILATLLLFVPLVAQAAAMALAGPAVPRLLRWGMSATMLAAFAAASWHLLPIPRALAAHLTGRIAPCAFASDYCEPLQEVARIGARGDRVLLAGYYGFWLRPDQLQCRDTPSEKDELNAADDLLASLRKNGFRFIVIDHASHREFGEKIQARAATSDAIALRKQTPTLSVYEVLAMPGASSCVETGPGIWKVREAAP